MSKKNQSVIFDLIDRSGNNVLEEWISEQLKSAATRMDLIDERELRQQSDEFLSLLKDALRTSIDIDSPAWNRTKEFLNNISRSRAIQGFSPTETAGFVFSLKQPLFSSLQSQTGSDTDKLREGIWDITLIIDKLGLYTTEIFQRSREEIIIRQQREMIEISTPVVQLWTGVLALPLIGTLDSARTQVVMENLLTKIVDTGSAIAIIDITGVPTVDTLVAQHLLKTVAAARLMGADCIISGIRPQIAQTIVHLGVDLSAVITKATMADAFKEALKQSGLIISAKKNQIG
ncbi:MAG: STAS domain-containing protein [Syntrophothermus sp.]